MTGTGARRPEGIHAGSRSPLARDLAGSIKKFVPETFSGIYGNANVQTGWLSVAAYADLVSGGPEGAEAAFHTRDLTAGQLTVFLQIPLKVLQDTPAVGRVLVSALTYSVYEADGDGETACFDCNSQGLLGNTDGAVLVGVEPGEMFADDLFGGVALDALSTRVPTQYPPIGVEHVDGVVHHALNEQFVHIDSGRHSF